jgi:hypothetical protein
LDSNDNCWDFPLFLLVENFYNKKMKKNLTLIIPLIILSLNFLLFLNSALAEEVEIENPLKWEKIEDFTSSILKFLTAFALAIFPILIIIAGYQFMTAGGDPKKIEDAKRMLWYAFIGLLIILGAQAILAGIKSAMGVE